MHISLGHIFGTQNKYGYSLLVYGLLAMIAFLVNFGALTQRGQQFARKCQPLHQCYELKSHFYILAMCFMVFLGVIALILIFISYFPRTKSCG